MLFGPLGRTFGFQDYIASVRQRTSRVARVASGFCS